VVVGLLTKNPALTTATALGTIDFMNTSEVYSQLLMEAGESRPALAMGTGAAMSALDALLPLRVINRMRKGSGFASFFGRKLKNPDRKLRHIIAGSLEAGALEGSTEYIQTVFENLALQYVKENDMMAEFSEEMMLEQEEAGARGALIGALLGVPVSYMGVRRAAKAKADWITGIMEQQNAFINQPLLTFNPKVTSGSPSLAEFNAPVTTAINDKILESQIEWQRGDPTTQARERTARIMRDNWEGLLNSDMEATLDRADKSLLGDLIQAERDKMRRQIALRTGTKLAALGLTDPTFIPPPPDEVRPTYEGTVPLAVDRTTPVDIPTQQWRDIYTAGGGQKVWKGWIPKGTQEIINPSGSPAMKDGIPTFSRMMHNPERGIILKKESTAKDSDWVIVEEATGDIVERSRTQKPLLDKYAGTPIADPFTAPTTADEIRAKELESQDYERRLVEQGELDLKRGDRIRLQARNEYTGAWSNINPDDPKKREFESVILTADPQKGRFGRTMDVPEAEGVVGLPHAPQYALGESTLYRWKRDDGVDDTTLIRPEQEEDVRFVLVQRGAQKRGEEGERVTQADVAFLDELLTEKQRVELFPSTERGAPLAKVTERREDSDRFLAYLEDPDFRKRLGEALEIAEDKYDEDVASNIRKLHKFSKEEIETYIEEVKAIELERKPAGIAPKLVGLSQKEQEIVVSEEEERVAVDVAQRTRLLEQEAFEKARDKKLAGLSKKEQKRLKGLEARGISILSVDEQQEIIDSIAAQVAEETKKAGKEEKKERAKRRVSAKRKLKYRLEKSTEVHEPKKRKVRGLPEGENLVDSIDPETDEIPTPATYEVKIDPVEARVRGLNPKFFYTYTAVVPDDPTHWGFLKSVGVDIEDFISVMGHRIRKDDVVEIQEISGRAEAPSPALTGQERFDVADEIADLEKISIKRRTSAQGKRLRELKKMLVGDFVRGQSPENEARYKTGYFRGMKRVAELPDGIPNPETVREFWIDNKTGIVIIQREATIQLDDLDKLDVDYPYDYEVYITWYDREEHKIKLVETRERLLEIYAKEKEKFRVYKHETVDLRDNKKFLTTDFDDNTRGANVRVQVTPSMIRIINRERKELGLPSLPFTTQFNISKYFVETGEGPIAMQTVEQLQKRRKEKGLPDWELFVKGIAPMFAVPEVKPSQNKIKIIHEGYNKIINVTSATKAFVSRQEQERVGVLLPYEELLERGPERGVRLIGSFKGSIKTEVDAMEKLMADVFVPQIHAFGAFGSRTDAALSGRIKKLENSKDQNVLVEYFDGTLLEGQIVDVNREAKTFTIGIPKEKPRPEAKQRFDYVEVDILGFDRIQIEETEQQKKIHVIEGETTTDPLDDPVDNVIFVPLLAKPTALTSRSYAAPEPEATPDAPEGVTRVEVYRVGKGQLQKETKYKILIDGVEEETPKGNELFGITQALMHLNKLANQLGEREGIDVISMPSEIKPKVTSWAVRGISKPRVTSFERGEFVKTPIKPGDRTIGWISPDERPVDVSKDESQDVNDAQRVQKIADAVLKVTTAKATDVAEGPTVTEEPEVTEVTEEPEVSIGGRTAVEIGSLREQEIVDILSDPDDGIGLSAREIRSGLRGVAGNILKSKKPARRIEWVTNAIRDYQATQEAPEVTEKVEVTTPKKLVAYEKWRDNLLSQ